MVIFLKAKGFSPSDCVAASHFSTQSGVFKSASVIKILKLLLDFLTSFHILCFPKLRFSYQGSDYGY